MRSSISIAALAAAVPVMAKIDYYGVAMSGIDWGCNIDGSCPYLGIQVPIATQGGADSVGQMKHFIEDDKMNMFRIPVSWQYLTKDQMTGPFDPTNFGKFDELMQACLDTGAYCMLDLHNFARFDGKIIGEGGPVDAAFVDIWKRLATYYKDDEKLVFGLMNEPHDLQMKGWANSCQDAVTAIRNAGATKQIILLPGDNFSSAASFVSTQSAELLDPIKNPDGTKDGLIYDLHQYLDINNSGSHRECTTNNVAGFQTIAEWLRQNNRKAIISETGASMDPSCMTKFCEQNQFIANNTDVFIGFVAWSAGGFDSTYDLTLTPTKNSDGTWSDNKLMTQCIVDVFHGASNPPSGTSVARPSKTSTPTGVVDSSTPTTDASAGNKNKPTEDKKNAGGRVAAQGSLMLAVAGIFFSML